jgi:DNA-binding CsgD family transcriptional regulator
LQVAVEVADIAGTPASVEERASALLEPLRRVVPYQAGRIALLDPERREHVLLAERGYDDRMCSWFTSPAAVAEVELVGLHRAGPPMRVRDRSGPPSELRGWAEYLQPAGFRESLGVPLFAADGRHLGQLGMHTDTVAHPTDAARDLIGLLAPLLGHAVDPLRSITRAARIVRGALAAVVLTRGGHPLPLPGLPTHPLLVEGSALLRMAAKLAGGHGHAVFLCPYPGRGPAGHVRVNVLGCAAHPPHHMVAVVVLSSPPDLRGLTPVQLQILGLSVEGWANPRIAAALRLTKRAVAAHMAQIRAQLDAPTRAVATMRAARQGVYVPSSLTGAGD